ncbi:MAG: hypothetical protein QM651_01470 [Rhodoblastus sp.]
MSKQALDFPSRHRPPPQFGSHRVAQAVGRDVLGQAGVSDDVGEGLFDAGHGLAVIHDETLHLPIRDEGQQRVGDGNDGSEFFGLLATLGVQVDPAILEVHLRRPEVQDGAGPRQRVEGDHRVGEQVRGALGRCQEGTHLVLVEPVGFFFVRAVRLVHDEHGGRDFLPLPSPVDRRAPDRQDTADVAVLEALVFQPCNESFLPLHRQVRDRGVAKMVVPQVERIAGGFGRRDLVPVLFPIPDQDRRQLRGGRRLVVRGAVLDDVFG